LQFKLLPFEARKEAQKKEKPRAKKTFFDAAFKTHVFSESPARGGEHDERAQPIGQPQHVPRHGGAQGSLELRCGV
jgi:hypothetical protein